MLTKERILEVIADIICPCTRQVGLSFTARQVGLIREISVVRGVVRLRFMADDMTCLYMPSILQEMKRRIESLEDVTRAEIEVVRDALWEPEMMNPDVRDVLKEHYADKAKKYGIEPWAARVRGLGLSSDNSDQIVS